MIWQTALFSNHSLLPVVRGNSSPFKPFPRVMLSPNELLENKSRELRLTNCSIEEAGPLRTNAPAPNFNYSGKGRIKEC